MGNRSTDGMTLNKVLLGIMGGLMTVFVGVIAYEFTSSEDRTEKSFDRITVSLDNIAVEISKVNDQSIAAYGLANNNGAWLGRMDKENRDFRKETRAYWGSK